MLAIAGISCKVGPDYERPSMPMPTTFKSATTQPSTSPIRQDWWRCFEDPELTALEERALKGSYSLQAAMARVIQARAAAGIAQSGFYPVITANPSVARTRVPVSNGRGGTANSFVIPFDISYEVDIWGQVKRAYESAKAQAVASVDDFGVVRLTLTSDVAQNYFNLRSLDTQEQIIIDTVRSYREQLDLTNTQFRAGLTGPTTVAQAQTLLDSTDTQLIEIRRVRADAEHALAILLGVPPSELNVAAKPLKSGPPVIPAGLPSELLRQRPDVAEAEQQLIAANAQIGVAKANFYPSLNLTGAAGYQSVDLTHAMDWESRFWSLGANMAIPIFEGGKLEAGLQQAKARYDEVLANYRSTLLGAFRDVEDSLTDLHMRADSYQAQVRAVASAREYLRLTQIQYKQGFAPYLQVIDAERTLYSADLIAAQILYQRMVASIQLIKAMGGGWDPSLPPSTQPTTQPIPGQENGAYRGEK
jgi:multidrug efflux system outer membrane protein